MVWKYKHCVIAAQRTEHRKRFFTHFCSASMGDGDCRSNRERRRDKRKKCTAY